MLVLRHSHHSIIVQDTTIMYQVKIGHHSHFVTWLFWLESNLPGSIEQDFSKNSKVNPWCIRIMIFMLLASAQQHTDRWGVSPTTCEDFICKSVQGQSLITSNNFSDWNFVCADDQYWRFYPLPETSLSGKALCDLAIGLFHLAGCRGYLNER